MFETKNTSLNIFEARYDRCRLTEVNKAAVEYIFILGDNLCDNDFLHLCLYYKHVYESEGFHIQVGK